MSARRFFAVLILLAGLAPPALAQPEAVQWQYALPWADAIFHVANARRFAEEVRRETGGTLDITIRAEAAAGFDSTGSLRAVQENLVPMAQFLASQTAELPILGTEALPFLVADLDQLRALDSIGRPVWAQALRQRNQKLLMVVPWPSQNFFLKRELRGIDDLRGVRMRVSDSTWQRVSVALRMTPERVSAADLPAALASGRLDGLMGSMTTAVAQRHWRFFKYAYATNHRWLFDLVTVNLDAWNRLDPAQQTALEAVARRLEPEFWAISAAEDALRVEDLRRNRMSRAPVGPDLLRRMRDATAFTWEEYARQSPEAAALLRDFRAASRK